MSKKFAPCDADRETVRTMVACGIPEINIARCLGDRGIDAKTLRKYFRQELDTASTRANATIGSRLFAAAERGEGWAVCFWLKTRARFRETVALEHTGADGQPLLDLNSVRAYVQQSPDTE